MLSLARDIKVYEKPTDISIEIIGIQRAVLRGKPVKSFLV